MRSVLWRGVAVALLVVLVLTQLDGGMVLLGWEVLLMGVLVWQFRSWPGTATSRIPSLIPVTERDQHRLPRAVARAELAVVDTISGHLPLDRRLAPLLRLVAAHRLGRIGVVLDSPEGRAVLGDRAWRLIGETGNGSVTPEELDGLVTTLEGL